LIIFGEYFGLFTDIPFFNTQKEIMNSFYQIMNYTLNKEKSVKLDSILCDKITIFFLTQRKKTEPFVSNFFSGFVKQVLSVPQNDRSFNEFFVKFRVIIVSFLTDKEYLLKLIDKNIFIQISSVWVSLFDSFSNNHCSVLDQKLNLLAFLELFHFDFLQNLFPSMLTKIWDCYSLIKHKDLEILSKREKKLSQPIFSIYNKLKNFSQKELAGFVIKKLNSLPILKNIPSYPIFLDFFVQETKK
jgi:hypothetical protein